MPLQRGEGEGQEKEGDQDQEKAGKRKKTVYNLQLNLDNLHASSLKCPRPDTSM